MLFLAVTMGFFAENIREHFSDTGKEKQYLKSFMENLSMDERNLPRSIGSIEKQQILPADTLTDMLNHASVKKLANIIYYSFRRMVRQQGIRIYISDRTIEQEKNAGEMRLITDNQVSDSFIDYYKLIDYAASLQEILLPIKRELVQHYRPLLNGNDFAKVTNNPDHMIYPKDTLCLKSVNEDAINDCLLSIGEVKGLSITIGNVIRNIINKASNLKKMINAIYGLTSE